MKTCNDFGLITADFRKSGFLLYFLFVISTLPGIADPDVERGPRIGVVDLLAVAALHPKMTLFDFSRYAFLKIPFGLSQEQKEKAIATVRSKPRANAGEIMSRLQKLASETIAIERRRLALINGDAPDLPMDIHEREKILFQLANDANKIREEQIDLQNSIEFPEFSDVEETREIFDHIATESMLAIESVADNMKLDLVLNSESLFPNTAPSLKSPKILGNTEAYWLETDLYNSFLSMSETNAAKNEIQAANFYRIWMEINRRPQISDIYSLNPMPLVLKGGIDITADVVEFLLRKYGCASATIGILIRSVKKFRKNPFFKDASGN